MSNDVRPEAAVSGQQSAGHDFARTATSRVVLGVSGGIAAYKACELLRRLTESGCDVTVVPTAAALRFVGAATWEALSAKPVSSDVFSEVGSVRHVRLGREADLVVVAPATADLLAKAAHGLADDLLTSTLLTATCPVVLAPAMHTEMWEHAATRANVETLRSRGVLVVEPAYGRLTGGDTGSGRLPEPAQIFDLVRHLLRSPVPPGQPGGEGDSTASDASLGTGLRHDLSGWRVLVTAGGTREPLDPVRFLGNRSSGRQGFALAGAAAARGADVVLVAANVSLLTPLGVSRRVDVSTTAELREEVLHCAPDSRVVVMAAAPADYRPASASQTKIKKAGDSAPLRLELIENADILAELGAARRELPHRQVLVGFAAETGDGEGSVVDHARRKLESKGCDLLVANDVTGAVFGSDDNQAVILRADGSQRQVDIGSKLELAHIVWDQVAGLWRSEAG